jgi:outer membrane assembly lipoprotein YfiO
MVYGRSVKIAGALVVLALGLCTSASAAPQSWELKGGRWVQIGTDDATYRPATTEVVADATLDQAEDLLARRDLETARKLLLAWFKSHPQKEAANRDRGVYLLAQVYFDLGDRVRSFYHCDELMDSYPDSGLFYKALELQYRIADAYLKGFKNKFLGLPVLAMEDEAIEMLFRIQQRSPGSPIAERALLRTADYYYATSEFDLASDAYGAYVESYPRSPLVPKVRLRQAFSSLAQFRGLRFDATPLIDARAQLMDVISAYPNLAEEENLKAVVGRIDSSFAQKVYTTARFYQRTNAYKAAAYQYRFLIKTYPDTPEADSAAKQLALLPPEALQTPEPPAVGTYSPATKPAAVER